MKQLMVIIPSFEYTKTLMLKFLKLTIPFDSKYNS